MTLSRPIMVHLVWGDGISFQNGWLVCDDTRSRNGFPLFNKIDFTTLVDTAYRYVAADKKLYKLKLILWYDFNGNVCRNEISNDNNLETIYYLGQTNPQYHAQLEVQLEPIIPTQQPSFVDQLRNITQSQHVVQYHEFVESEDACPSTSHNPSSIPEDEAEDEAGDEGREEAEDSDDAISEKSNDTRESYSIDGDVSGDSENEEVEQIPPTSRFGFVHEEVDAHNHLPFDEDEEQWVYWSKETGEIHKGMVFQSKAEAIFAIRLWNIKNNREMLIQDTRPTYFKAHCFTRGEHYKGPPEQFPCMWTVSCSRKNKHGIWRISKWTDAHNCYGNVRGNNNRCLTSSLIASDIDVQVNENIAYPIKHIQAHVKNTWNVEISYDKAWNARRIAIERIFGTWESNFAELPRYVDELVHANPDTVVQFLHHPTSSSQTVTFKYVFWAFGPPIRAFQLCIPVICVDGTHLKGSYRGKLLTAVTKNANGQILPVAFALVDEETNESWAWFLQQFQTHVAAHQSRELCVISDRHQGILNAVNEMDGWHHRYCLRHVRSNFMSRFRDHQLKKLCWVVGSTTQYSTYLWGIRSIKAIDPEAWRYLKDIDPKKWAVYRDEDHRRWGNLTTNIAESLNNVLRYARMMPIKTCIEYTFDYTRIHFIKHYREASNWTSPLSRKMWQLYQLRERNAPTHTVEVYDIDQGVYKVRSMYERNGDGGNDYIVKFGLNKCTCGRWQNQRFPCSHAIAVCGHREVDASIMVSKKYTTRRWKSQYSATFNPLRDVRYWRQPTWIIQADSSRMITHRGRRRARRIRNEMDDPDNRARQQPRCRICNELGHNKSTCPNR